MTKLTKLEHARMLDLGWKLQSDGEYIWEAGLYQDPKVPHQWVADLSLVRNQIQQDLRDFVRREVGDCVSHLVYTLTQSPVLEVLWRVDAIDYEDGFDIWRCEPDLDDYREQADDDLEVHLHPDGIDEWAWTYDGDLHTGYETEFEAYKDAYETLDLDKPEGSEVFEHWIVSNWFADKLAEYGHPVNKDFIGLTIWGRPTTGQAIYMDGVIEEIYSDL